ncbi:hypothetical protein A2U01_0071781, partial [Trifolium medium]|nr:hypothetical protein [Trifolium medium]
GAWSAMSVTSGTSWSDAALDHSQGISMLVTYFNFLGQNVWDDDFIDRRWKLESKETWVWGPQ